MSDTFDCDTCGTIPDCLLLSRGGVGIDYEPPPPAWEKLPSVSTRNYPYAPEGEYRQCPQCRAWFVTRNVPSDHFYEAGDTLIMRVPAPDSEEARLIWEREAEREKRMMERLAKDAKSREKSKTLTKRKNSKSSKKPTSPTSPTKSKRQT